MSDRVAHRQREAHPSRRGPSLRRSVRRRAIGAVLAVLCTVSGCAWNGDVDAAGMTQEQVAAMSPERQFDLMGERYARLEERMADAQRVISTGRWHWIANGMYPESGSVNRWAMPGATAMNSYFLETSRSIRLPGATGERADAEPMVAHFEAQGWPTTVHETSGGSYKVRADTEDGSIFAYTVQPNGQYSLRLMTKVFWGDRGALSSAVIDRTPQERFEVLESLPGEVIPYPKWSDPVIPWIEDEDEDEDEDEQ